MIAAADMLVLVAAPFIGSFVATLAHRLPAGAPVALGRSACPVCRETLPPWSLVPVLSWLAQHGRCRHCRAPISPSYPLIEFAALALSVWVVAAMTGAPSWLLAASCVLGWTLLALSLIDARHFILPDVLTLPLGAAGLVVTYAVEPGALGAHVTAMIGGFAALALINMVYRRLRGQDGLGLGDAKLLGAGGAWIGLEGLAGVVLIASVAGLAWALAHSARQGSLSARARVAFGPFLAIGIWVVWLHGPLEFGWTI